MTTSNYSNPIISGFNPDPSICRVGNDFYLVTSTFQFFPGVPIYHSQDLANWTQIGNVLSRPEQLADLDKTLVNGGIWAPTIRYHKGTYYMITTMVFTDKPHLDFSRWRNFFVTATNPAGPWSDPVFFDYPGYDPSFTFDDENDGQVYVQGSFYHRIRKEISQSKIDVKTGETDPPHRIWSGTGEKAPEAPHILYKNGWYYLIIAEGGTELGHRVTMARSRNIDADEQDWEACPTNPIITHFDLPDELVQCVGHADLFQNTDGQWHMVLLASRAYDCDHFPMGRETFLVPVNWDGDWPMVQRPIKAVSADSFAKSTDLCPFGAVSQDGGDDSSSSSKNNYQWALNWLWLRLPDKSKYHLIDTTQCVLTGSAALLDDPKISPTLVGLRQGHVKCRVTVELSNIQRDSATAGLTAYLDCHHYHAMAVKHTTDGHLRLNHIKAAALSSAPSNTATTTTAAGDEDGGVTLPSASSDDKVTLAIETNETEFYFEYKQEAKGKWHRLATVSSKELSTGFTGVIFGLFVTGDGSAQYGNFNYQVL
ncbi:glycosyl hydrolase [Zychaea mexicana]|uniref:glycosyl hydrolase n=1 Tax=Zychaea mexicana TaxID=64656 RepID=UPI0022FF31DC|nr:glycosyl hydrolase [Zychaea mexicana]KAI9495269.1 glycosyl hydrolase [Zychaea mexicana]